METQTKERLNIKQAVSNAATFLSQIEKQTCPLDERDKNLAHRIRVELEAVEQLLYTHF